MKKIIEIHCELEDEAVEILESWGFKRSRSKNEFYHSDIDIDDLFSCKFELYDVNLHLDQKWEERYKLFQGYRCPTCDALDTEPNLKCVKNNG